MQSWTSSPHQYLFILTILALDTTKKADSWFHILGRQVYFLVSLNYQDPEIVNVVVWHQLKSLTWIL